MPPNLVPFLALFDQPRILAGARAQAWLMDGAPALGGAGLAALHPPLRGIGRSLTLIGVLALGPGQDGDQQRADPQQQPDPQ